MTFNKGWQILSLQRRVMTLEALYNALISAIEKTNPELHKSFLAQPLPKDIPIMTKEEEDAWLLQDERKNNTRYDHKDSGTNAA